MRCHLGFEGPDRSGAWHRTVMAPQTRGSTASGPPLGGSFRNKYARSVAPPRPQTGLCGLMSAPCVLPGGPNGALPHGTEPTGPPHHTTPHPPRPPVGPFSASTRPDSAAAVRSAPPPCRHVPALPGWFAPPHGGERRRAAAHRPYGSPGCAPCRPARRLRQEGGHGHRNRCPGCLGACGARPRSAYIPVVWNATHVQMRASAASTPHRGPTRPPGWAGSLRGSSRSPLEVPYDFFAMGVPPGCNLGLKKK